MKSALVILALCLVSTTLGNPTDNALINQPRGIAGNIRTLVEELIQNLRTAIKQAYDAVKVFSVGITDQGKLFTEKLTNDIQKARERIQLAIKSITDRFTDAGSAVRSCIDSLRKDADNLFNDTIEKSKQCAGDRITEIGEMINNLRDLSSNATEYTSGAVNELKECTDNSQGFLSTSTCLGGIAVRTELKGASFLARSGLLITRINLALTTLPAALEVCAGSRIVEVGVNSAKIVMEIGTCSATSAFSSLTGNAAA